MRLRIECELRQSTPFPINHQHHLTATAYRMLQRADADYARFLHDDGYAPDEGPKRFKLFCFSGLRCKRRRVAGGTLWLGPGVVQWHVGSPVTPFLQNFATGLLAAGTLEVGAQPLSVISAQCLPDPDFHSGRAAFTCLTPIVAAVPRPQDEGGGTRYLRPCEGEAFSAAVRKNLLAKIRALRGTEPSADEACFEMTFDPDYLADPKHREGTKLITYKDVQIVGAQAPFTVVASPLLLETMWQCGAGEKNAGGFGMVELTQERAKVR